MRLWWLFLALFLALAGCGGSGGSSGGGPTPTSLSIVPSEVTLGPNEEAVFSAAGASSVNWSVTESGGGAISAAGRYKAPATVGSYHVVATAGTLTAQATVNVTNGAFVTLTPLQGSVAIGETFKFTATVQNGTGTPIFRVVESDGGTVDQDGTYTPPATPGTYHVRADLSGSSSAGTEATITVTGPVTVAIADGPRLTSPGARLTFVADVTGSDSGVTWATSAGTIDSSGKLIAPDTAGEVTVTATSVTSHSKTATATVEVIDNPAVRFKFTGQADVVLRLNTDKAPKTSANLVSLVNEGFYTGIKIHRVDADVVQWGDPLTKTLPLDDPSIGTGGPGYTIPFEANDLKNLHYSLGMARASGLDTGGSQIYVCLKDEPDFDGNYVVFGQATTESAIDALVKGEAIESASVER